MNKVTVVSELGHNFNGNIRLAKLMIEESKKCGADAVKLQLYDTDKIKETWQSRYAELKFSEINFEETKELKRYADKVGIELFATPFDVEKVKWCEKIGVKRYKIASRSIRDSELIGAIERTKKPIIASLGYWSNKDNPKIKNCQFLYCIAEYPAYITNKEFPAEFGEKYQGFSDHTIGMYWAREAIKRGATIIEKHFTLSKDLPGHDQKGSVNPEEMKDFITYVRQYERGIQY
jgi:sialic acid synthase SpsE